MSNDVDLRAISEKYSFKRSSLISASYGYGHRCDRDGDLRTARCEVLGSSIKTCRLSRAGSWKRA